MKKCLNSRKNIIIRWIGLLTGLCSSTVLIIIDLFILYLYPNSLDLMIAFGLLFITSLGLCVLGVFFFVEQSREYMVDPVGITIRYLKRFEVRYPWNNISEISVCDINHAPKDKTQFDIVIRIVVGLENKDRNTLSSVLSGTDHWRDFEYGLIHFKKVIIIDYSKERLTQIRDISKLDVMDYLTNKAKPLLLDE